MTARTFLAWVLVLAAFAVGATPAAAQVEKAFINPAGGYTHVVTVKDRGVKTIYVSGQVGSGIDLQAHAESAFQGVADPGADFELTRIGPSRGFSQAVVARHGAVKTIWVSGQTGRGDDLTAQTSFVFERVSQRLADAGAAMADVVKINTYIVNFDPEQHMGPFGQGRASAFGDNPPSSTLLGIDRLVNDRIQPVALLDRQRSSIRVSRASTGRASRSTRPQRYSSTRASRSCSRSGLVRESYRRYRGSDERELSLRSNS